MCDCGDEVRVTTGAHAFSIGGGVAFVAHGVEERRCITCGATSLRYPAAGDLRLLALRLVVGKPGKLEPAEIRMLRKELEWSSKETARRMGTTKTTVSRWENGANLSPTADRLFRALVALKRGWGLGALDGVAGTPAPYPHLEFHDGAWRSATDPSGSAPTPAPRSPLPPE